MLLDVQFSTFCNYTYEYYENDVYNLCSHDPKMSLGSFSRSKTLGLRNSDRTPSSIGLGTILLYPPRTVCSLPLPHYVCIFGGLRPGSLSLFFAHHMVTVSNNRGVCLDISGQNFPCMGQARSKYF